MTAPHRQSPLLKSPDLYKYKDEWAYVQDLSIKRQEEAAQSERLMKQQIMNQFKQDLKNSVDNHKQVQLNKQMQERIDQQESPLPLYQKQISHYQDLRKQAMSSISQDCHNFNNKTVEQQKEIHIIEKIRDKADAERRIKDAQASQWNYQEQKREEKNYIKSELLNANYAQEEIKRIETERALERNKAYAELELQQQQDLQNRRQMNREQYIQKYQVKTHTNPIQDIYLENHLKQIEDRKNLEKLLVEEHNLKKQRQEEEKYQLENSIRQHVKDNFLSTLNAQIALKQEVQNQGKQEKQRYNEFLQEKDKEVHEWQNVRKLQQQQLRKDYNSELMDQILQREGIKNQYMDQRELVLNKQMFENGVSKAVPGMVQDHRRQKQLSMISQSFGYQNSMATPEIIQMYNNPRSVFPGGGENSSRRSASSLLSMNSLPSLNQINLPNNKSEQMSPQKNRESFLNKEPSSILIQSGKNLFG